MPFEAAATELSSVLETCLYARDLDAAATFYRDVLGLELVSRSEGRHVFFRCGSQMVLLFNPDATNDPESTLPPHGADGPGHIAFGVTVAELDAWRRRLRSRNIAIEKEMEWGEAGRSIYIRDPAGNSVELATPNIWPLDEED